MRRELRGGNWRRQGCISRVPAELAPHFGYAHLAKSRSPFGMSRHDETQALPRSDCPRSGYSCRLDRPQPSTEPFSPFPNCSDPRGSAVCVTPFLHHDFRPVHSQPLYQLSYRGINLRECVSDYCTLAAGREDSQKSPHEITQEPWKHGTCRHFCVSVFLWASVFSVVIAFLKKRLTVRLFMGIILNTCLPLTGRPVRRERSMMQPHSTICMIVHQPQPCGGAFFLPAIGMASS